MADTIVSTTDPDHAIVQQEPDAVTREIVITDGCQDAAAVDLSHWAGASSEASLSDGVPSARMQRTGRQLSTKPTKETTLGDRSQSLRHNVEP